jgi:DNA-binding transcriptional LysR family regulator
MPAGTADLGPEVQFDAILPGHNVIACGIGHPLLRKRHPSPNDVMIYPWVAPLPGSPLMLDLHSLLLSLGISELAIRYSGGSLLSVVNYIAATNALAILPHSVVLSLWRENKVSIVQLEIPQPERTLGIITKQRGTVNPAARKLGTHIAQEFINLKAIISRYERTVERSM